MALPPPSASSLGAVLGGSSRDGEAGSSGSTGSGDASPSAAAAAVQQQQQQQQQQEQQQQQQEGDLIDQLPPPGDLLYLHTSLTERYKGKFHRLDFPTFEQMMAEDAMNNCGVRSVIAGAGGAALGAAFGIFSASLDTGGIDSAVVEEAKPTRQVLRETLQLMRSKSLSYAKGFAVMGFVYSSCECLIEKKRARHDVWNAPLAGCAAGAIMATPAGPKAMGFGCASFAAFSYAIEKFMGG